VAGVTSRTRRPAAVVLLVAVVLGAMVVGGAASGLGGAGTGSVPLPRPVNAEGIVLEAQTTFVGAASPFTMDLRLGTTEGMLSIALHPAVTSRTQFGATLAGEQLGNPIQRFDSIPLDTLAPDANGVTRIQLVTSGDEPPTPFTLRTDEPGVYPLSVTVSGPSGDERLITHVTRLENSPSPTANESRPARPTFTVGVLVRLNAPTPVDADGSPVLDERDEQRLRAAATAVAANPEVPATVHTTGAVIDALSARSPLDRNVGRNLLRPTWVPVDLASLTADDLGRFVDRQLLAGNAAAERWLLGPGDPSTWVLDETVDPAALALLAERGVQQVIVPEDLTEPLNAQQFPTTLTQSFTVTDAAGGSLPALQTDTALTALLGSTSQPALAANRVLADLSVLAFDYPDVRRVAVVDTGDDPDAARALGALLTGLNTAATAPPGSEPLLATRSLGTLFAASEPVGAIQGQPTLDRDWSHLGPTSLGSWPTAALATETDERSLAVTVLPGPDAPVANATVLSAERLVLASGATALDDDERQALLEGADTVINDALAPIGIPTQGTVTLTASTGVVPITLENGRPEPVAVRVTLQSDKLEFPDGSTVELRLDPGSTRHEVAVEARASGAFPVEVTLRTGDDARQLAQGRFTVRSGAVSGIGLILSIVAGVFLLGWWARHLRSARRSRQLIDRGNPGSVPEPVDR
jgi:hypothetical protein